MIRDTTMRDLLSPVQMKNDANMMGAAYDVVVYTNVNPTEEVGFAENQNVIKYRLQYEEKRTGNIVQVTETPVRQHCSHASVLATQLGPLDVLSVCLDHDASVSKSVSEINETMLIEKKKHVVLPIIYTGENTILTVLYQEIYVVVIKDMVKISKLLVNNTQCSNPFAHNEFIIPVEQLARNNICHKVFKVAPGHRVFFSNRVYFYTITVGDGGEEVREILDPIYPSASEVRLCTCGKFNNPRMNYCRFCKIPVEPEEWERHERDHTTCFDCKKTVNNMYLHILQTHKSRANLAYLSVYERNSYRLLESEMKAAKKKRTKALVKREKMDYDATIQNDTDGNDSSDDSDCPAAKKSKKKNPKSNDDDKDDGGAKKKRKRKPETEREKGLRIDRQKRFRVKQKTIRMLQKQLERLMGVFNKQILKGSKTTLITQTVSCQEDVGPSTSTSDNMQPVVKMERMLNPEEPATSSTPTFAESLLLANNNDDDSGVEAASFDTKDCNLVELEMEDDCSLLSLPDIIESASKIKCEAEKAEEAEEEEEEEEEEDEEEEQDDPSNEVVLPPTSTSPPGSPKEVAIKNEDDDDDDEEEEEEEPRPLSPPVDPKTSPRPSSPPVTLLPSKPPSPPPQPESEQDSSSSSSPPPPPPPTTPPRVEPLPVPQAVPSTTSLPPPPPPSPVRTPSPHPPPAASTASPQEEGELSEKKEVRRGPMTPSPPSPPPVLKSKYASISTGSKASSSHHSRDSSRKKIEKFKIRREKYSDRKYDHEKERRKHDYEKERRRHDREKGSRHEKKTDKHSHSSTTTHSFPSALAKYKIPRKSQETTTPPVPEERKESRPRACHPPSSVVTKKPYVLHPIEFEKDNNSSKQQHHRTVIPSTVSSDKTPVLNVRVSPRHSTSVTFPSVSATSVFNRVNPPSSSYAPVPLAHGVPVPSATRLFSNDIIPSDIRVSSGTTTNRRYDEPRLSDNYKLNGQLLYNAYDPEKPTMDSRPLATTQGSPRFLNYSDDDGNTAKANNYDSMCMETHSSQYLYGTTTTAAQDYNNYQEYPQLYSMTETMRAVQSIPQ